MADRVVNSNINLARPWCCPEPRCTPVHQLQGGSEPLSVPQPGEAFVCFGKSAEVRFSYDGVDHANDLRQCAYTALKGVLSFQENVHDWRAMQNAYGRALAALDASLGAASTTLNPPPGEHTGDQQ